MRRRWAVPFGAIIVAINAFFLTLGGDVGGEPAGSTIRTTAMLVARLRFLLGGADVASGVARWYRFVGVGDVLMGRSLTLAFIGVDWGRGGRQFDLSTFE